MITKKNLEQKRKRREKRAKNLLKKETKLIQCQEKNNPVETINVNESRSFLLVKSLVNKRPLEKGALQDNNSKCVRHKSQDLTAGLSLFGMILLK
jgi:hypothetical protein